MAERDVVSTNPELLRIRGIQDKALEWIVAGEPDTALSLLRGVNQEVEETKGTFEWARQPLLVARAYAVKNHEVAEHFFNDALERTAQLSDSDPQHSLLVHKCFGKYLFGKNKFRAARKQFELAEQVLMVLAESEQLAQMHLRIIEVGYRISNDERQQQDFELFKKVAYNGHCTSEHQYRAWMKHEQGFEATAGGSVSMRYSMPLEAAYFKRLLDSTAENGHEADEEINE